MSVCLVEHHFRLTDFATVIPRAPFLYLRWANAESCVFVCGRMEVFVAAVIYYPRQVSSIL